MARIPEIIRRNPLSQVAPQAPRAGAGWAALADLAGTVAEFVTPAAEDEARQRGENSVYRDDDGNLKVESRSLYSGKMGAIQNQAAFAKYLAQKNIDLNQTMSELSIKYEFDPAGFRDAADAYVKTLSNDPNLPDLLREDIKAGVQNAASQAFNGLHRKQVTRTYKEADRQTATARDLLMDDYVSLYVEGDEEGAAAKWAEITELNRMRANAPYISETPAEVEAFNRGVQGTAKAARLLRDLQDLDGADEISDEKRQELLDVLKDPDITPATRQKLYAATQGRLKSIDAAGIVKGMTNDSYAAMVVRAESGGNNKAKAATSSAYGPHQFLKGTWAGLVKKYKPAWAKGLSEGQIQAMRGDRAASNEMFAHFRRENQAVLSKAGMPINPATEYMAHFFGAGMAVKVLAADPSKPLSEIVPAATIKANGFLKGMTARDAQNWAARKMTMKASDLAAMQVQIDQIDDPEVRRIASQGLNERIRVRQNIEDAAADVFNERLATGDVSLTEQEIRENHDLSTDAQVKLSAALDKANQEADEMRVLTARINGQGAPLDPSSTKDRNAVNKAYEDTIGDAAPSSEHGMAAAAQLTERTGIIPKKASNAIKSAINSDDPAVAGMALESLSALRDLAGGTLNSVVGAKGLEDLLSDFQFYGQFGDRAQAAEQMIKNREKKPKNVTDEAKEAAKKLEIGDVTARFDQSWFSDPKVGDARAGAKSAPLLTGPQQNEMMSEYTRLFKDAYVDVGDFDLAQNRALDQMDRIYGMNSVSGVSRVMKYPPQKVYPPVAGSHDWMTDQIVAEVNDVMFGDEIDPDGPSAAGFSRRPGRKRVTRDDIALVSDGQTAAAVKSGRPASYLVYAVRDGSLERLPQRFTFDPAPAQKAVKEDFEMGRARRKERAATRESLSSDGPTQDEIDQLFSPDLR